MRRALILALLAAGCGDSSNPPARPAKAPGLRAALLKPATSADAWRISGKGYDYFKYEELSGPVALTDSLREQLTELLLDPQVVRGGLHRCVPTPGVKVRFNQPNAPPTWVFFCFECRELFVYEGGLKVEHQSFDDGATALTRAMQRIFTQDKVIQSLK